MFPNAPEPFIDLSTGINPHPYPLPPLPAEIFVRLPDRASVRRLAAMAAQSYGAPSADHVVPAPGTQILLPQVAMLVRPGRAAILRTTYAEHARAASLAGHSVTEVADADQLETPISRSSSTRTILTAASFREIRCCASRTSCSPAGAF